MYRMDGCKLNDDALFSDKYMGFQNTVKEYCVIVYDNLVKLLIKCCIFKNDSVSWSWIIILFNNSLYFN
jgi:hypothetical protein